RLFRHPYHIDRGVPRRCQRLVCRQQQIAAANINVVVEYQGNGPLLEVAGGAFRERFTSRGLTLHYALPDSMTVFGDPDRLMQLF
ncbi:hypothetical protein MJN51_36140, partial [Salmonella enterica subsp. enterica serovar Kentucky]|nr:hypothetical protein [Salmonella enterica subsp. enterica serovar Kentucky]